MQSFFSFHILFLFLCCLQVYSQEIKKEQINDTIFDLKEKQVELNEVVIEQAHKSHIKERADGNIKLTAESVQDLPSLSGNVDLIKILELTPGVQNTGDGNTNIFIRGGDASHNQIIYNDAIIYFPGHMLSFFPLFNIDHLSSIELSKSGANSQYGGFLSSNMVLESKRNIPQKTSIKGNIGIIASQLTLEQKLSSKFGIYISARKTYMELLVQPLLKNMISSNKEEEDDDLKYNFTDANITLVGELSPRNKLIATGFISSDKLNVTDESVALDGYLKWNNLTLSLKLETELSKNKQLEQVLYFSDYTNKLFTGQAAMNIHVKNSLQSLSYKNKFNFTIQDYPITLGYQYSYYDIVAQNNKLTNNGLWYNTKTIPHHYSHDNSLYLSSIIIIGQGTVEPGARYNLFYTQSNMTKTYSSIDLRLKGKYPITNNVFARVGFSINTQYIYKISPSTLGLSTDFWVSSSAAIKPQKGEEISGGIYFPFSKSAYELSADIFYKKIKNTTELDLNFLDLDSSPLSEKLFFGEGKAYGLEILLKKNTGKITGWLAYSIGKSLRKFKEINNGEYFPAKFDRTHDLSLVLQYQPGNKWDFSFVYVFSTGNAYTQPTSWYFINNTPIKQYDKYNNVRMPNYSRTDVSVNYRFNKQTAVNFSLYNTFMVKNPIYVFLLVRANDKNGELELRTKRKKLYRIIPSVSFKFNF